MRCGYVLEGTHTATACSSMVEHILYTDGVAGSSPARPTQWSTMLTTVSEAHREREETRK